MASCGARHLCQGVALLCKRCKYDKQAYLQEPHVDGSRDKHVISTTDLQRLSAHLVKQQRLEAPAWDKRSAPLSGKMWVSEREPGMQLRLADIEDRFGLKSQALLPAGVKIALVVQGSAQVRYGHHETLLGPEEPHSALIATLPDKTPFVRTGRPGTCERTLTLSLSPRWLARHGYQALAEPPSPAVHPFTPSSGLLALAKSLFETGSEEPTPATRLIIDGFATLLAGEALKHAPQKPPVLAPGRVRLARLMALIDRGEARGLSQKALARRLGMSLSALQRSFSSERGEPLGQFLRRHHLDRARKALEQEAISIEQAAMLAGYTSATNFATAFKREFGVAPSDYRSQRRDSQRAHRDISPHKRGVC